MINNKIIYTFIVSLVFGFFVLGFNLYKQALAIDALEQKYNSGGAVLNLGTPAPLPKDTRLLDMIESQSDIIGKITTISGGQLVVEVSVPNIELLASTDTTKPFTVEQVKKNYTINITEKTVFETKKLEELKVGDIISVSSLLPVFEINKFNALVIKSVDISRNRPSAK